MGSLLELLGLPSKIVPAAPRSDDEFLTFCKANEPYQFEMNDRGEILLAPLIGLKAANFEGYVFRELDRWVEETGHDFAVNANVGFRLQTLRCACRTPLGYHRRDGTL
jgi:Uma2 family endonuclease